MIIAVCGNLASGKTTLAKYICNNYDFYYVPYERSELSFLNDFFDNIHENFLQTQLAFLTSKASQISSLLSKGKNIVIDRSLEEDIHVFAQLWIDGYNIEERITKLYFDTATYIVSSLPIPDLYILCDCSPEISIQRLSNRPQRSFESKYPPNHIEKLYDYLQDIAFPQESTYIRIDSSLWNFTNADIMQDIMFEIKNTINYHLDDTYKQLSLFNLEPVPSPVIALNHTYVTDFRMGTSFHRSYIKEFEPKKKCIYLAAPFTALTSSDENTSTTNTFEISTRSHGILPKSYQKQLEKIRRQIITTWHTDVILPHKDVNQWGHIELSSDIVIKNILENINNCDCIVAIPSTSIGVHLELGIAIAQHKPIIIFEVENLKNSFYVPNLDIITNIKRFCVNTIDEIPKIIQQTDINILINQPMEVTTNEIF